MKLLSLTVVIMCLVACLSGSAFGEDMKIKRTEGRVFFKDYLSSELQELSPYSELLKKDSALPAKDYEPITDGFIRGMKLIVPGYVPDNSFVQDEIMLIPAKIANGKEDIACLSYEVADRSYRIVKTSGGSSCIWLFVHNPLQRNAENVEDAAELLQAFLDKYIKQEYRFKTSDVMFKEMNANKLDRVFRGETKPIVQQQKHKRHLARFYLGESESCLFIQITSDLKPAQVSRPDEWFSDALRALANDIGSGVNSVPGKRTDNADRLFPYKNGNGSRNFPPPVFPSRKTKGDAAQLIEE